MNSGVYSGVQSKEALKKSLYRCISRSIFTHQTRGIEIKEATIDGKDRLEHERDIANKATRSLLRIY